MENKKKFLLIGILALLAVVGIWIYYRKDSAVNPNNPFAVNTATGIAARNQLRQEVLEVATAMNNTIAGTVKGKDTSNMTAEEMEAYQAELAQKQAEQTEINAIKRAYQQVTGTPAPESGTLEAYRSLFNTVKLMEQKKQEYTKISGDNDFSDNNFVSVADIERAITVAKQNKAAADKKAKEEADAKAKAEKEKQDARNLLTKTTNEFVSQFNNWQERKKAVPPVVAALIATANDDGTGMKRKAWNTTPASTLIAWLKNDTALAETAQAIFKTQTSLLKLDTPYKKTAWAKKPNCISFFSRQLYGAGRTGDATMTGLLGYASIAGVAVSPRGSIESKEAYQNFLKSINLAGTSYDWR